MWRITQPADLQPLGWAGLPRTVLSLAGRPVVRSAGHSRPTWRRNGQGREKSEPFLAATRAGLTIVAHVKFTVRARVQDGMEAHDILTLHARGSVENRP